MALTGEQLEAVRRYDENICVIAGAGTGKTLVLVERYLRLMDEGGLEPHQLAAITFTEKAAAEMLQRLRRECRKRADEAESPEVRHTWETRLANLATGYVGTIHSFCRRLISLYPVEAGVDPRFAVLTDADRHLVGDAVNATIQSLLAQGDADIKAVSRSYRLATLKELLEHALRNREKVARAAIVLERPPEEQFEALRHEVEAFLAATVGALLGDDEFKKAAGLILAVQGPEGDGREISRQLAAEALQLVEHEEFAVKLQGLRGLAAISLVKRGSKLKWPNPELYEKVSEALKAVIAAARDVDEQCAAFEDSSTWPADLELGRRVTRVALRAIEAFQELKRQQGLLDFDDLLITARDLLRNHSEVRRRLARRYRQVLVDELQDTDELQLEILGLLLGDGPQGLPLEPRQGSFFGVGDPKQSIYRFRGADVQAFRNVVAALGAKNTVPLSRTFRFHEGLARSVNATFKGLLAGDFAPLVAEDQTLPPVSVEVLLADSAAGDKGRAGERRRLEAARIAARIHGLLEDEKVAAGDIAILMHRQSNLAAYENALKHFDIPYYVVSGRHFYQQQEVRDVIMALQTLCHPGHNLAMAGLLRSPFFGLSDDALLVLARGKRLGEALASPPLIAELSAADAAKAERARAWLTHYTERAGRIGVARLIEELVFASGLAHAQLPQFLGERRYANLRRLLEKARQYDQSGRMRLEDFLEDLQRSIEEGVEEAEAPLSEEGREAVLLMTVHKAKGLEFPYVFAAIGDSGPNIGRGEPFYTSATLGLAPRKPDRPAECTEPVTCTLLKRRDAEAEVEEFKRLFYVAATRAQKRLFVTGSRQEIKRHSWLDWLGRGCGQDFSEAPHGAVQVTVAPGAVWRLDVAACEPVQRRSSGSRSGIHSLVDGGLLKAAALEQLAPTTAAAQEYAARLAEVPEDMSHLRLPVTSLVDYARCPAFFYFRHVLGLRDFPYPEAEATESSQTAGVDPTAAAVGTVVHEWLGTMELRNPVADKEYLERRILERTEIRPEDRPQALRKAEVLIRGFTKMPLARELGEARQVFREMPFVLARDGVTLSGTIDLLMQDKAGDWTLVDYKTDHITAEKAAERAEHYELQLRIYAEAAQRFFKTDLKKSCLAFLFPGILRFAGHNSLANELTSLLKDVRNRHFEPVAECNQGCQFTRICGRGSTKAKGSQR